MGNEEFVARGSQYVFNTYGRTPIMLVKGSGCRVTDSEGREYLDFIAGIAACTLGHAHPALAEAIANQANTLIHVSNLFHIEPQIALAERLVTHSFAGKAFFCNSGAEACEGAIKLARRFFYNRGQHDRFRVITMRGSFHGRTLATLAATGQTKYRNGFEPPVEGFSHVPFGDLDSVEAAITPETAAVMVEPIQGEGGVQVAPSEYFVRLRDLCDRHECLLIFDEVQTGMGRTGRLFAYEHFGMAPDIMTLAKGVAGGFPMGVLLATDDVASVFVPGTHASTFGGNPLACAAGLAVVEAVLSPGFLEEVQEKGRYLNARLRELATRHAVIHEVRGRGLMQAIELTIPGGEMSGVMREQGVLVNCTAEKVLRFVPPLIVTREEIDEMIDVLESALANAHGG